MPVKKKELVLPFNSQAVLLAAVEIVQADGVSKGEFARKAGMGLPLLGRYLKGEHVMTVDRLEQALEANGLRVDAHVTPL